MATSLTQDEYLVLQHLLSGTGAEEIATILELPLHVVRTCIHMLVTWVLDELEPSQNGPVLSTVDTVQVVAIDDGVLVDGELDMDAADDFLRLAEASVDGTHEVVLDIADLGFIDSAGVGAILRLASTSCPNGIVLRRPREGVQHVLDIGKIEEIPGIRVEWRDA